MTIHPLDVLLFLFSPVYCSISSSNCCFLTCIQVSQETGGWSRMTIWSGSGTYSQLHWIIPREFPKSVDWKKFQTCTQTSDKPYPDYKNQLLIIKKKCWCSLRCWFPLCSWTGTFTFWWKEPAWNGSYMVLYLLQIWSVWQTSCLTL